MGIPLRTCALCLGIAAAPNASLAGGWFWQNPFPQGNDLNAVAAIDTDTMVAVGNLGAVVKTTDGGLTWSTQHHAGGSANDLLGVSSAKEGPFSARTTASPGCLNAAGPPTVFRRSPSSIGIPGPRSV